MTTTATDTMRCQCGAHIPEYVIAYNEERYVEPPQCPGCIQAEAEHYADMEREHELERQHGGLKRCPRCDRFTLKVRAFPTRQYGGGWDTTEQCTADDCDYAEVYV